MEQLDLFDLVDANNFSVLIHYMDDRRIRRTELIGTSKDKYLESIGKWRQEHPKYFFLYCETFNEGNKLIHF